MKKLLIASLLLSLSLASSRATAQTTGHADVVSATDGISAARTRYLASSDPAPSPDEPLTLAQYSRSGPGRPVPRRAGDPRPSYPRMWAPSGGGKHALIGALVGFGIGAGVAAKGHASVGATVALGAVGGAIGASFGAMGPPVPSRSRYRRSWNDEYGEDSRLPSSKAATAKRSTLQATVSSSTGAE